MDGGRAWLAVSCGRGSRFPPGFGTPAGLSCQVRSSVTTAAPGQLTLCSRSPGYQISWEVYGRNSSRLTHSLSNTTHEYKIKGLSSLTTYTIDVAAVTAAGTGLATSSTISSGVPPGQ